MSSILKKERFYSGRCGESPADVVGMCVGGAALIGLVARISSRFGKWRILFELCALTIGLTIIVWKSVWWSIIFVFGLFFKTKGAPTTGKSGPLAAAKVSILLLTAICIIFVDFPAFPMRHGKVAHYIWYDGERIVKCGLEDPWVSKTTTVSLMDTGAAFFLILNGFARLNPSKCVVKGLVNIGLWLVRIIATKSTSYFTPEGEYARGCNFFGYLGAVELIAAFVSRFHLKPAYVSILFAILNEFVHIPFLGYLVLFFLANDVGFDVGKRDTISHFFVGFLPLCLSEVGFLNPLREEVNTSFVMFCFSIFYITLLMFDTCELSYGELSTLYKALNEYPLVFFGIANIATGVINLLLNCNESGEIAAFSAIAFVLASSSAITLFIDNKQI